MLLLMHPVKSITHASKLSLLFFTVVVTIFFWINAYQSSPRRDLSRNYAPSSSPLKSTPPHRYAFSAFLAAPAEESDDDNEDHYFVGTRMMIYQLLHDPQTRTNNSYPFLVMVTVDVSR